MKNKILCGAILFAFCAMSMSIKAQLTVTSSGDINMSKHVAINNTSVSDSVAISVKVGSSLYDHNYGIYSTTPAVIQLPFLGGIGCDACVVGQVLPQSREGGRLTLHPFTVGIAGLASTGVAVYGTTNSSLPIRWGTSNYAGYFDGNVNVIGTLTATTVTQTSDSRFKENVTDIESTSAQYQLLRLRPVSYTFRQDSTCRSQIDKNDNRTHYGLIAQELQQIFPELVYEDGDGYLSVNYTELIPLILKQIQELSAEVSDLKAKVNQSQTRQTSKKQIVILSSIKQSCIKTILIHFRLIQKSVISCRKTPKLLHCTFTT